ncbi:TerC family protein [Rhizobium laguerreae]|nr:TerC family protein [Rhizobium laguerreae]
MFLDWMTDPSAWVGLLTLVVLELVLGIDNLVFISILASKLPEKQREKARLMGLGLALVMRLVLLSVVSWIVTLTKPLFAVGTFEFSGRDVIMIVGGLFLLFKGTMELHERLEGHHPGGKGGAANAVFWQVLIMIVALDAVFSIDSIITAVGMTRHLEIMTAAVIISMIIMMLTSRPLMEFVSRHPTVVVLCLGFLMMIGMSLLADGFGFHIEKSYMYAAIGFAVAIEAFNLFIRRSAARMITTGDLRDKTASAILGLLGAKSNDVHLGDAATSMAEKVEAAEVYSDEEKDMVRNVLAIGSRSVRSIMSPRTDIDWLDVNVDQAELKDAVAKTVHSRLLVSDGELENLVGVISTKEVLVALANGEGVDVRALASARSVLTVPDVIDVVQLLGKLRVAPLQLAVIYDEHGSFTGLVTPTDILEAIAGEFPDEDEGLSEVPQEEENTWVFEGWAPIDQVNSALDVDLSDDDATYTTINGFVMAKLGDKPAVGTVLDHSSFRFEVEEMANLVVGKIKITKTAA